MKKAISLILTLLLIFNFLPLNFIIEAFAEDGGQLIIYPEYDERIPRCYDYSVTVHQGNQSKTIPVYNRNANGEQMAYRCLSPDFNRRFCEFAFTGEVRVDITVYRDFETYSVLPSAKRYRNEFHDGVISVWLNENDTKFMIRLDDDDDTILSVFADAPEDYDIDLNDESVLYVDEPWFDPDENSAYYTLDEKIRTIYIAPGCVFYSRLIIKSNNVTICGHGILLDPFSDLHDASVTEDRTNIYMDVNGNNFTIKDVKIIDSQGYHMYLLGTNHLIKNVKCLTARIRTDGVAVGAGNVTITNCFWYVSDNGFTYSGGYGYHRISNCIMGTTCAAFFPQHTLPYDVEFTDIYVFRADEGIINNWYNGAKIQSVVKNVTFNNLDCVDVINTPWIFSGKNMGDAVKNFYFNNCRFNAIRGSSIVTEWNTKAGQAIHIINNDTLLHTSNYKLNFKNCYIDGKLITSESDFKPQYKDSNELTISINNDGTKPEYPLYCVRNKVNYTYNKKVYINHNLQKLQHQPIGDGSEILLPETEICNLLDIKINANTKGTTQNGIKYISLDEINRYYTKAVYDSEKSAVILSPVVDSSKNLLKDYSFACRYNPYSNPGATLKPYVDNGEVVLRCIVTSNIYNQGLYTVVTDELEKYGAGVYTISFEARSYNGNKTTVEVRPHYVRYEGYSLIEKNPKKSVTVNGQWQRYEVTFDISDWDLSVGASAIIRICSDNTPGYDVLFKNIALTKVVPEVKKGDIVLDGNINSLDMMKLKKYLIRETQFNYDELLRADVNSDGEVNSTDYAYLKRYILRIIDAFPQ
ncbi:MAG TPA: dockerin [Hungateiclostridium thermocellum]|uniref:Dockerin type 1 n=1 Tax=Acetivibrio thermocellus (strain ATCC 27405 / DSM 1237 / JCM 9322 / NBRC 103400 / NCIMB 10682 / NRRL B-4536 / VPI 7372) TaxID=203119 RepID=A3DH18_ACET2|nr:dockerin type I repeat-containing protein [Acetivibrio thermocellus]ABN53247.1 Dockerin type 1 [Acetivibrio thermocellus ATCC 27405]HBW27385.1 dockerin [Acetivibrio thermocellus]